MEIEDLFGIGNEGILRGELDFKSSRIVYDFFFIYFICIGIYVIKVFD